jgi:16S rRNA (guanine966-N2)-methyltransferase
VISQDAMRVLLPVGFEASLVFLDPPYGKDLVTKTLRHIAAHIEQDALIVCEDNCPITPPVGFKLRDQRQFGGTWITLLDAP